MDTRKNDVPTTDFNQNRHSIIEELSEVFQENGYCTDTYFRNSMELIAVTKGSLDIIIGREAVHVIAGEYIIIVNCIPHSLSVCDQNGCKSIRMVFHSNFKRLAYFELMKESELGHLITPLNFFSFAKYLKCTSSPQIHTYLELIQKELIENKLHCKKVIDIHLYLIFLTTYREMNPQINSKNNGLSQYVIDARAFIDKNYRNPIGIAEISDSCHITSRYLSKLFDTELNITVSNYLSQTRVNKAIEYFMFQDDQISLTDLSVAVGFSSLQHFSKIFKETMGISPKKYFNRLMLLK